MKQLFTILILFVISHSCPAITRHVPSAYPTIQAALNACITGDSVVVQPGTYNENLTWPGSAFSIKLVGAGGAVATIVSGGNSGRVLNMTVAGNDTNTVVKGFTFTNGYLAAGSGYGAGIYVTNNSPLFEDVIVSNNRVFVPGGHGYGAGMHLSSSSSVLRNCVITGNSIDSATWCYGGGVYVSAGLPRFYNVTISNNSARAENWCYGVGLYVRNGADIELHDVRVTGNISGDNAIWYYGSGIYMDDVTADFFNVLVASNRSGAGGSFNYGGGIYCDGTLGNLFMANCTVTDNSKTGNATINGSGIYARDAYVTGINSIIYNTNTGAEYNSSTPGLISFLYSDVRGGFAGIGNINMAPGFVSSSDFHLLPTSPCAGTGTDNGATFFDLDGVPRPLPLLTMPDMGCYEVDQSATSVVEPTGYENAVSIYPNPVIAGNMLNIQNAGETFTITDVSGRIIFSSTGEKNEKQIETSGWEAGWYFIFEPGKRAAKFSVIR